MVSIVKDFVNFMALDAYARIGLYSGWFPILETRLRYTLLITQSRMIKQNILKLTGTLSRRS